jgi:hypothetical protein
MEHKGLEGCLETSTVFIIHDFKHLGASFGDFQKIFTAFAISENLLGKLRQSWEYA